MKKVIQVTDNRTAQELSDEWFINNLIGLASAELALSKKTGKPVDREKLADWIKSCKE